MNTGALKLPSSPSPPYVQPLLLLCINVCMYLCTVLGKTIAGTTDSPISVSHLPAPDENDIKFILSEVKNYLSPDISVRRGDVQAAWSGLRPLVRDPNKSDTQSIARNHIIEVSPGELVTIAGGTCVLMGGARIGVGLDTYILRGGARVHTC